VADRVTTETDVFNSYNTRGTGKAIILLSNFSIFSSIHYLCITVL
jgi:hypothetical protein